LGVRFVVIAIHLTNQIMNDFSKREVLQAAAAIGS
jgi:hypothetical protein